MRNKVSIPPDPPADMPRPRFARRKALIVRAAAEIINRKGVRGMTLADVASRLDLVPTAVNYYFRRKEDLAAACFLQAIAHYNSFLDRSDRESTPQASLLRFLHDFADYLAAVATGDAEPIAVFNDVRTLDDRVVSLAFTNMFRRIRRIFPRTENSDAARRRHNALTHLLISQVFWAVFWLRNYEPGDYRRMIDRLHAILVHGLAAPGAAWSPATLPRPADDQGRSGGAATHAAFMCAATEMINEHGYLGASVKRISARLNVTKGSFYHHNQAKDDLVAQCFDRTLGIMHRSQADAEAATATGLGALATLAASMVTRDVSGESPLLRTSALTAVPEELQHKLTQRINRYAARLASVISDGVADGSLRPVDANVAAQVITGLINASAELRHWAPGLQADEAAEIYVRPLFMGLFNGSY